MRVQEEVHAEREREKKRGGEEEGGGGEREREAEAGREIEREREGDRDKGREGERERESECGGALEDSLGARDSVVKVRHLHYHLPCPTNPHNPTNRLISRDRNNYPQVQINRIDGHIPLCRDLCQGKSQL